MKDGASFFQGLDIAEAWAEPFSDDGAQGEVQLELTAVKGSPAAEGKVEGVPATIENANFQPSIQNSILVAYLFIPGLDAQLIR